MTKDTETKPNIITIYDWNMLMNECKLKYSQCELTLALRVKATEHTSAPSCALSNVLIQRPPIASHILIVPSKLPVA